MPNIKNKTILITGGTGSFGHELLDTILDKDFKEVRIFSRDELKQEHMRIQLNNHKVKFYIGDVPRVLRKVIFRLKPEWATLRRQVSDIPTKNPSQK